jgi:predicted TIM-barrel fold metal-dependent hydrolase
MPMNTDRRTLLKMTAATGALAMLGGPQALARSATRNDFIMDVHVHAGDGELKLPEGQPQALNAEIYRPWKNIYDSHGKLEPRPTERVTSAQGLIEFLDRQGVDVAVVMPFNPNRVARRPEQLFPGSTNDTLLKWVQAHPDRLVGICGHDPLVAEWKGPLELERMVKEHGFKGMNDERLFPLYEKAVELGAVLTFHTGWTPLLNAPMKYGHPDYLDEVGIRYPELKVNMAHIGGAAWWKEAILVAARHKNFTMDLSSWCTYPPYMLVQMLDLARQLVGLNRVLFGSEQHLCPPSKFVGEVRNVNTFADQHGIERFAESDITNILGLNAARVYGVEPRKRVGA